MRVEEAINYVDRIKPNQYDHKIKINWLSQLDGMIFREIFLTHEGCRGKHFDGYDCACGDMELLVPSPYDEDVYGWYLQARIDKENGETAKYNQSITLFNNAYMTFVNWYNRTHMPLPPRSAFRL